MMTREEAAKMLRREIECLSHSKCEDCILEKACDPMRTPLDSEYIEAFEISIKALEAEPKLQQALEQEKGAYNALVANVYCDDCISREAMHIELEKWITYGEHKYSNATKYLYDRIDRLPSVSPQQRTGKWMPLEYDGYADGNPVWDYWECSECGWEHEGDEDTLTAYCPHCGAKMESEGKE